MWNFLQVLYEGMEYVKEIRIIMLTKEFELFCMESSETVEWMQTRFTHLLDNLVNLVKYLSNQDFAKKFENFGCNNSFWKIDWTWNWIKKARTKWSRRTK